MGYGPTQTRPIWKNPHASAAETATANSGNLDGSAASLPMQPATILVTVDSTAVSGSSPTLDITFEYSFDGGTTWIVHSAFTQITGAVQLVARFNNYAGPGDAAIEGTESAAGTFINAPYGPDHRFLYTIGGSSPSFTFAVWVLGIPAW